MRRCWPAAVIGLCSPCLKHGSHGTYSKHPSPMERSTPLAVLQAPFGGSIRNYDAGQIYLDSPLVHDTDSHFLLMQVVEAVAPLGASNKKERGLLHPGDDPLEDICYSL
jgi:hypothetical protein